MEVYQDVDSGSKSSRPALNQLISDGRAKKFDCLLVWKLDRFGRSLVDCLNHIRTLEENSVRFIAVTQGLDTGSPKSGVAVLAACARSLIRERAQAGQIRYRQDFEGGNVGKTAYSRSGRNMPPHRPRRVFDREEVFKLRRLGRSYRQIAKSLGLVLGTVVRTLQGCSKSS